MDQPLQSGQGSCCESRQSRRKWLLLISACLIQVMTGQCLSGPIYANFMRHSYGLNQRQLDLCIALMYLGTMLIMISGVFYDQYGARASIAFGGVLSSLSLILLAVSMAHPEPLRQHVWLLYTLLFLHGHSFNYSYVSVVASCMKGFPHSQLGTVMTMLDISFTLGPSAVAFFYYVVFNNMNRSTTDQSPIGTRIVLVVFNAAVHTFAYFFLEPESFTIEDESKPIIDGQDTQPTSQQQQTSLSNIGSVTEADGHSRALTAKQPNADNDSISENQKRQADKDCGTKMREFLSACLSARFLPFLFGIAFTIGPNLATFLNVTSITRSMSLTAYDVYFFWLSTISGAIWRCLIGPLSDRYLSKASERAALLLASVACFGFVSSLLLSTPVAAGASPGAVIFMAYILDGLNNGSMFLLAPVLVSQTEPRHMFGRLYSSCLVLGSVLALLLMFQFGAIYDLLASPAAAGVVTVNTTVSSTTPSELECFGQACYVFGGVASTFCQVLSVACLAFYLAALRTSDS